MMSWEKERQISKETPSSPILNRNSTAQSSAQDLMAKSNFPPDFKKKYEQWQKIKDEPGAAASTAVQKIPGRAGPQISRPIFPGEFLKFQVNFCENLHSVMGNFGEIPRKSRGNPRKTPKKPRGKISRYTRL